MMELDQEKCGAAGSENCEHAVKEVPNSLKLQPELLVIVSFFRRVRFARHSVCLFMFMGIFFPASLADVFHKFSDFVAGAHHCRHYIREEVGQIVQPVLRRLNGTSQPQRIKWTHLARQTEATLDKFIKRKMRVNPLMSDTPHLIEDESDLAVTNATCCAGQACPLLGGELLDRLHLQQMPPRTRVFQRPVLCNHVQHLLEA